MIFFGVLWFPAKGEDSYFPIGVFGIGHRGTKSLVHEESCFVNLGMNFMLGCTRGADPPKEGYYEDTLMTLCDENGMKLCAGSNPDEANDFWEQLWQIYYSFHRTDTLSYGYHHSWTRTIGGKTWQQRVDSCLTSMKNHYSSHPSFFGYLALHENNIYCDTCNQAADYICQWINQIDPSRKSLAVGCILYMVDSTFPLNPGGCYNPTFFTDVQDLDIFYSECPGIVIPGPGGTDDVQEVFDYHIKYHEKCDSVLKGKNTKWYVQLQCQKDSVLGGVLRQRRPTPYELRCMTWLALSRGAKGVGYYVYLTNFYAGRIQEGLIDTLRLPYDRINHPNDTTYSSWKWAHCDFRTLGPVLAKIDFDTATSISPTKPFDSLRYITDLAEGGSGNPKPFDSLYFELATFADAADTDYFLVVNRQCLPTDTVCVSIVLGNKYEGKRIWVIDQLTKEIRSMVGGVSNMVVDIAPGDGRLFKVVEIPPWNSDFPEMTAYNNGRRLISAPKRLGWVDLSPQVYVHEMFSDGDSVYYTTRDPVFLTWTDPRAVGEGTYPALAIGRGIQLGDTLGWQRAACWLKKSGSTSKLYYSFNTGSGWSSPYQILSTILLNVSPPSMVVGKNYNGTIDSVHISYGYKYQDSLVCGIRYLNFPINSPSTISDSIDAWVNEQNVPAPVVVVGLVRDTLTNAIYNIPGVGWIKQGDIWGKIRSRYGIWSNPVKVYDSRFNAVKSISADIRGGNCFVTADEGYGANSARILWGFGYVDSASANLYWLGGRKDTVEESSALPSYPHISRGVAVSWQNPDSDDVYVRIWTPWDNVWQETRNLSRSPDYYSRHPQTMVYRPTDSLWAYISTLTIWTEGDTALSRYWINEGEWTVYDETRLRVSAMQRAPGSDTCVLPFYYLELGKSTSTPFTVYRDTFAVAGINQCADVGYDSLVYQFPYFEPAYRYGLMVELPYCNADNTVIVKIGPLADTIRLRGSGIYRFHIPPPKVNIKPDKLRIKLQKMNGQYVACSRILIYEGGLVSGGVPMRVKADMPGLPGSFSLFQNFPNPCRQTTTIEYQVPVETKVGLKIYDVTGRLVRKLVGEKQKPGSYVTRWDGKSDSGQRVAAGIYFYRLETKEFKSTKKIVQTR